MSALTGNRALPELTEFDDHVAVLLQVAPDPDAAPRLFTAATIDASWLQPQASDVHGHYRMRVIGTRGTAEVDWAYGGLTVTTADHERRVVPLRAGTRRVQFFFDPVREGRPAEITAEQAISATRIALLAQVSADTTGSWQTF